MCTFPFSEYDQNALIINEKNAMHRGLRLEKGQGAENKKRALLIFLRAHFWFPKALLSLKVYDIFNMKMNIIKRHPFSLFLLKGKKNAIFEWRATRALFILWKGRQGTASFWNCLGETLNVYIYNNHAYAYFLVRRKNFILPVKSTWLFFF